VINNNPTIKVTKIDNENWLSEFNPTHEGNEYFTPSFNPTQSIIGVGYNKVSSLYSLVDTLMNKGEAETTPLIKSILALRYKEA